MNAPRGVDLPAANRSASTAFGGILRHTAEQFPALGAAIGRLDRKHFGESLVRFEALRASLPAPKRVDAAELLVQSAAGHMVYADGDGRETPLPEYMRGNASPLRLTTNAYPAGGALKPKIV